MPAPHPSRRVLRAVASATALGLAGTALSVVAAPAAHAADPVELQLLNLNDFHGRIDANTTKFATTVENLRAAEPNTLLLSAGDNVGATVFASSVQQDNPTIDVLNALGLKSSAVGNHEFDKGAADLTGRVEARADWRYLGANVYRKGTTTPALPEYDTFEVGGVTVGVIGVVTQETATIVSPAGIADLDFGNPVQAVNRVAAQLTDADPSNGEADVVVAEYHEGAGVGEPASTLAGEVAKGGAFASIVNDTVAAVDVIFTGHSHATYAWDAPVPGAATTRPIVQTGSYGANLGQVTLTYDPDTDAVTAYDAANVARVAQENTALPAVAKVKTIVDAALANAAQVGSQAVGRQVGDITTAFTGGTYTGGRYTGGSRDDRASESTLGNLVAETLLAGPAVGDPDFGVTNPGGLRAELLAAGDTSQNPLNADRVITYAEAAAVLPFGNTVALVELTGAQIDQLFEQQWRNDAEDPYLQLGVSDNLRVTADPSRPAGDRITSIRLDGKVLEPATPYTVSTLNFLAGGADGFTAFSRGKVTDTGILDIEMFAAHLRKAGTVRPDYARQQVEVSGTLPDTITAGAQVDVDLADLDLTSQGSPANTRVKAFAVSGASYRELGTFPVTNGAASVDLTVPADLAGEQGLALVAEPSRTVVGAALPKLASTLSAPLPAKLTYGQGWSVPVTVSGPLAAAGRVRLMDGDRLIRRADLVDGKVTLEVSGRALVPGYHRLRVAYLGDDNLASNAGSETRVGVAKAAPRKLLLDVKAKRIVVRRHRPLLAIRVRPPTTLDSVSGTVRVVIVGGQRVRLPLVNGRAVMWLPAFRVPGRKRIQVTYLGSATVKRISRTIRIRVSRR
ncbi:5'-nucleotidase C-terminal domain-containing protein [Nocardioides sp. W7]|uniref:5'-nucleotidase C-terminal domain-containing protein n=1 Tax=Nocardioides sp. W7 TaxID=2931390 RepID=UPI001FD49D7E|nr:5'-nucleotidase C-terminal domain-containing protein [Nocardioides sp. W7]